MREVETRSRSADQVELAAILIPSIAEEVELDAVVDALEAFPLKPPATWSVEANS